MEFYGWTLGTMPPWVMTLFVCAPPLWQTARMVRQKMDADAKARRAEQPAAPAGEESPEVLRNPQMALYTK